LAADISEKGRQKRTKVSRLMYTTTQTGDPWSRGSASGTKILKGVKKICNAILQAGLTDLNEIWHDGWSYGVAGLKRFWYKFLIVDISGIFNRL